MLCCGGGLPGLVLLDSWWVLPHTLEWHIPARTPQHGPQGNMSSARHTPARHTAEGARHSSGIPVRSRASLLNGPQTGICVWWTMAWNAVSGSSSSLSHRYRNLKYKNIYYLRLYIITYYLILTLYEYNIKKKTPHTY